ncbi:MAG: LysM peptidoglycan-binding domain-containing protein [Nitrospiraceae bacterium]
MMQEGVENTMRWSQAGRLAIAVLGGCILSGCVMAEKYEAEKARSLNFQRLLAQEEKRTAELDSEVKRTKRETAELDARNRELTAQVQAVREQMGKFQEEAEAMKEAALLERKARDEMKRATKPMAKIAKPELPAELAELAPPEARLDAAPAAKGPATYHQVKPGETLFRISRRYGVPVEKIRSWNKLPDDIIEVGQKLIVGNE